MEPMPNGLIDIKQLESEIRNDTVLIIMHVNNEIGVIQDIESIGKLARSKELFSMLMQLKAQGKLRLI